MDVHSLHPSPTLPLVCPASDGATSRGPKWMVENCRANIAPGSEFEATQCLNPAPRLLDNDFCSTLYFAE